jgi:inward rectifier potassium channel
MNLNLPFRNNKLKEATDLGFGTRLTGDKDRLLKDGKFNIEKIGRKTWTPYQDLVEMSAARFSMLVVAYFGAINLVFAFLIQLAGMDCLNGAQPAGFLQNLSQAFFFCVQTFTTVGYGGLHPACFSTNLLASVIALTGIMSAAIVTGLLFARFSRPVSSLQFSRHAIIAPYRDGLTSFQFRIANCRENQLINIEAKVTMSWVEDNGQGEKVRRFARLPLEIDKVVMLSLNWNIVHPIDEKSPFAGKTPEDVARMNVEVIILIEAFDESFSQTVFAQHSYCDEDLLWNVRFNPMYYPGENGRTVLDLDAIDSVVKVAS